MKTSNSPTYVFKNRPKKFKMWPIWQYEENRTLHVPASVNHKFRGVNQEKIGDLVSQGLLAHFTANYQVVPYPVKTTRIELEFLIYIQYNIGERF